MKTNHDAQGQFLRRGSEACDGPCDRPPACDSERKGGSAKGGKGNAVARLRPELDLHP